MFNIAPSLVLSIFTSILLIVSIVDRYRSDKPKSKTGRALFSLTAVIIALAAVFTYISERNEISEKEIEEEFNTIATETRDKISFSVDSINDRLIIAIDSLDNLTRRAEQVQLEGRKTYRLLQSTYKGTIENLIGILEVNTIITRKLSVDYSLLRYYHPRGFTIVVGLPNGKWEKVRYPGQEHVDISRFKYSYRTIDDSFEIDYSFAWSSGPPSNIRMSEANSSNIVPAEFIYSQVSSNIGSFTGPIVVTLVDDDPVSPVFAFGTSTYE